MPGITFTDHVQYQQPSNTTEKIANASENFFNWGGRTVVVLSDKKTRALPTSPTNPLLNILKFISCLTIIIPLAFLILRTYTRSVLAPQINETGSSDLKGRVQKNGPHETENRSLTPSLPTALGEGSPPSPTPVLPQTTPAKPVASPREGEESLSAGAAGIAHTDEGIREPALEKSPSSPVETVATPMAAGGAGAAGIAHVDEDKRGSLKREQTEEIRYHISNAITAFHKSMDEKGEPQPLTDLKAFQALLDTATPSFAAVEAGFDKLNDFLQTEYAPRTPGKADNNLSIGNIKSALGAFRAMEEELRTAGHITLTEEQRNQIKGDLQRASGILSNYMSRHEMSQLYRRLQHVITSGLPFDTANDLMDSLNAIKADLNAEDAAHNQVMEPVNQALAQLEKIIGTSSAE